MADDLAMTAVYAAVNAMAVGIIRDMACRQYIPTWRRIEVMRVDKWLWDDRRIRSRDPLAGCDAKAGELARMLPFEKDTGEVAP